MAYEALARTWRPKTFEEIVGQGHVTRALTNALSLGKIHHAYLFSGTRGVGKTTFARILARALNCEKGPTAQPCLECAPCREILAGTSTDVQEIDGASNTGIDDVRRLRENAAYSPARARYKVYIIDEVHMLSKQAFNGLLKILEEPPPHVVFVFATTEPNRIPDTILSRVQRFDFRMLTEEEIAAQLERIAAAEGIRHDGDALRLVARYAFGSMRDGQSIFEQAAVSGAGNVTDRVVEEMLGLVGPESAIDLVQAVVGEGADAAFARFSSLVAHGADLKFLYLSVVDVLRDAAVLAFTGQESLLYRHSPSSLSRVKALVPRRSREEWMFLLDIAFRSERDVLGTEFQRVGFELLLLRLVNAPALLAVEGLDAAPRTPPAAAAPVPPRAPRAQTTFARAAAPKAVAGPAAREDALWKSLLQLLEAKKKNALRALLSQMEGRREGDALVVACRNRALLDLLKEGEKWSALAQAVEEAAGRPLEIRLGLDEGKAAADSDAARQRAADIEKKALSDPLLIEAMKEFDGATILSVRPRAEDGEAAGGGDEAADAGRRGGPGEEEGPE